VANIVEEDDREAGAAGSTFSCKSVIREEKFLQKEFAAAVQPYGWSDVSRKANECNVITMRRFSRRNQFHFSLLRALRAVQVPIPRTQPMSKSCLILLHRMSWFECLCRRVFASIGPSFPSCLDLRLQSTIIQRAP
jgi:hypothetical protein